jgi:thymidylate synthase
MNNLDKRYTDLLQDILDNGTRKMDRTGTGTISVFGRQIRHKMSDGFPLLTTKKMAWKTMVTELLWFLRGDTSIEYLLENDCNIWTGDAFKNYLNIYKGNFELDKEEFINAIKTNPEFAEKWGSLGPVYGKQWRSWRGQDGMIGEKDENGTRIITWNQIDQIANLINDLKTNPDSRRLMVNAWAVHDLPKMVLPPCHYGFQVYTRELSLEERTTLFENSKHSEHDNLVKFKNIGELDKVIPKRAISLMWNQRSVDTFLGLPFNIASYGLLLEIIAKEVNMVPDELIGNLGDTHLYSNHVEQAKEQIGRDYTLEERLNMVSEEIQNEFSSGIVNLPNFPNAPVWSDDGKMSCLDDFGVPRRTRESYSLPTLNIFEPAIGKKISILDNLHIWSPNCFIIENYQSHPAIKAPLSN